MKVVGSSLKNSRRLKLNSILNMAEEITSSTRTTTKKSSRWPSLLRWIPTSTDHIIAAEKRLLSLIKTPYTQENVSIGSGPPGSKIKWFRSASNESRYINTVTFDSKEDSPTLVMVHGYGASQGFFFRNFDFLAKHFKVIAIDQLGWGGSSRPDFTCRSTEETEAWFIDSFEEWRKAKNLSNFILLGHSFGGYVAAKYALKHPEHVKHLVLVGSAGFSSESEQSERLTRFRATWKGAIVNHLWESNFTPQKIIRGLGPWGPDLVRKYTTARFGSYSTGDVLTEEESKLLTDYVYHTLAAKASGELCLKYIFSFGAFARSPLIQSASEWKVPTSFIYGFDDWMSYQGAQEARKKMNVPCDIIRVPRLDRNSFSGPAPPNLNNLTKVSELFLSNNRLIGPLPNLTSMNALFYVDISNNTFDVSDFPLSYTNLHSLTTIVMEDTNLQGQVPEALFSIPQLQTVILRNNHLNGTIDIGSSYSNQLQLVDLQNNNISAFMKRSRYNAELVLVGNPYCENERTDENCILPEQSNSSSYSTKTNNCVPTLCKSDQTSSPNCVCAYPYRGHLYFKAPSFSNLENSSIYTSLELSLMSFFRSHQLPVDSVSLKNPTINLDNYLVMSLDIFPSVQNRFNRTGVSSLGFVFSNQTYKPDKVYGTYYFIADNYVLLASEVIKGTSKSSSIGIVIGAAAGGCVVVLLLLLAGIYALRQKKKAKRATKQSNPFASWESNTSSTGGPQLKGARCFSYEELEKITNNFSEANAIGAGGYGKVYRGTLPSGMLVAIKRAEQGSLQGGHEFKTEIELLSRVHHKNVVSLMGFCFEQGEQMLVYEYVPNGSLKESLSGKSGIRMDWTRRLKVALGAAKGLQYLHDLANPPIIHRDIKSNNILLDEHLNAKVADFGLSKPMGDPSRGHVTTQVKGTMGYLDPEYYMTQQLTEKSDVYSFGVLMLELITARRPIENGKYIVREVKLAMDKTKEMYNLHGILDKSFGLITTLHGMEQFVDLAMRCVDETGDQRPPMRNVVKEIENIMSLAGFDNKVDTTSSSSGYEETSRGFEHPYSDKSLFVYSATQLYRPPKVEPK